MKMKFEVKDYHEVMRDVFKSLCDEEIIEYDDTEPMKRCYFKTKEREYSLRLWSIKQINKTKLLIDATLSYYDGTCFLKPYQKNLACY